MLQEQNAYAFAFSKFAAIANSQNHSAIMYLVFITFGVIIYFTVKFSVSREEVLVWRQTCNLFALESLAAYVFCNFLQETFGIVYILFSYYIINHAYL